MEIFSRVVPTGIDHGTVTVLVGGDALEVTTLRGDGAYTDGRHPDSVVFIKDIEGDLARRDFTINAMAWEPEKRILHDPFRGRDDLAAKLLRAVGDPAARFSEDGLRVMRAARFAATLDFDIEKRTLEAIPVAAPKLVKMGRTAQDHDGSRPVTRPSRNEEIRDVRSSDRRDPQHGGRSG